MALNTDKSTLLTIQNSVIGVFTLILLAGMWRVIDRTEETNRTVIRIDTYMQMQKEQRPQEQAWQQDIEQRVRAMEVSARMVGGSQEDGRLQRNKYAKKEDEESLQ